MKEIWDVYDENRNKTGETMFREDYFKGERDMNKYHLAVHVWIKNSKGEWLISKRTPNKSFPLLWEQTGGSVLAGEDSLAGALREVREELGIALDKDNGYLYTSLKRDIYPDFCDVWIFNCDCDIKDIILQEDETCDAMWASSEKIKFLISDEQFVPLDNMQYVYDILK